MTRIIPDLTEIKTADDKTIGAEYAPNPLSKDADDKYFFQKTCSTTVDLQQIVQLIANKNPGMRKEMIESVAMMFMNTIMDQLMAGRNVNLPLFYAQACLVGNSPDGQWDPQRNSVALKFRPGTRAKEAAQEAEVYVSGKRTNGYYISGVINNVTKEKDNTGFAGRTITLLGKEMKVAGDKPEVGVRLVNHDTQEVYLLDLNDIVTNNYKTIALHLRSDLPEGEYTLTITNQRRQPQNSFAPKLREMSTVIYISKE